MNKLRHIRTSLAGILLLTMFVGICGCDAGDTNPVSPDKMEEIRKKDGDARGSFQPKGGPPPPSTGQ